MTMFLGMNFPTPNITGLLSQSWIYIAIILILVIIAAVALALTLFFMTYSYKVELYENIGGGTKMVRTLRTRARRWKVGAGGEELLKLLRPRVVRTAYGRLIAPKTYAFAVGSDGYWYNITMGDLDTKLGILDVEPVERDMRMMQVAVEKIIDNNYNPNKNAQMVMSILIFVIFAIALTAGWIYLGKMGTMTKDLSSTVNGFKEVATVQNQITEKLINAGLYSPAAPSGLVPAG